MTLHLVVEGCVEGRRRLNLCASSRGRPPVRVRVDSRSLTSWSGERGRVGGGEARRRRRGDGGSDHLSPSSLDLTPSKSTGSMTGTPVTLFSLPSELLAQILSHLDLPSLASASSTNSTLHSVCHTYNTSLSRTIAIRHALADAKTASAADRVRVGKRWAVKSLRDDHDESELSEAIKSQGSMGDLQRITDWPTYGSSSLFLLFLTLIFPLPQLEHATRSTRTGSTDAAPPVSFLSTSMGSPRTA